MQTIELLSEVVQNTQKSFRRYSTAEMTMDSCHHIIFHDFYKGKPIFRSFIEHCIFPLESDIFPIVTVHHYSNSSASAAIIYKCSERFQGKIFIGIQF